MQIFKREQHRNNMNSKKTLGFSNGLDYNEYLHSMNKYNLNNSTQQNVLSKGTEFHSITTLNTFQELNCISTIFHKL